MCLQAPIPRLLSVNFMFPAIPHQFFAYPSPKYVSSLPHFHIIFYLFLVCNELKMFNVFIVSILFKKIGLLSSIFPFLSFLNLFFFQMKTVKEGEKKGKKIENILFETNVCFDIDLFQCILWTTFLKKLHRKHNFTWNPPSPQKCSLFFN